MPYFKKVVQKADKNKSANIFKNESPFLSVKNRAGKELPALCFPRDLLSIAKRLTKRTSRC